MKIEINWEAVAEEIRNGDYSTRHELVNALARARKMCEEKFAADLQKMSDDRIAALRALKRGATVYYTGNDLRLLGKAGMKAEDARVYMTVAFNGKLWKVPYKDVNCDAMSTTDVAVKKGIINIFQRLP